MVLSLIEFRVKSLQISTPVWDSCVSPTGRYWASAGIASMRSSGRTENCPDRLAQKCASCMCRCRDRNGGQDEGRHGRSQVRSDAIGNQAGHSNHLEHLVSRNASVLELLRPKWILQGVWSLTSKQMRPSSSQTLPFWQQWSD